VAVDRRWAIGRNGRLPWRLPDDLRRFKALTLGHPVIMGRKTFQSIGRALPGRTNVVVTRQHGYRAPGATVVHSLQAALAEARAVPSPRSRVPGPRSGAHGEECVFVIGGGQLYAQTLPLAGRLYVTHVETEVEGADAHFPALDPGVWREVAREGHPADDRHPFPFSYVTYELVSD
jgi:dihydrofolate reductase